MKHRCTRIVFALCTLLISPSLTSAQHLRVFACAIGNDSAGAFLGGSSRGSGLYQSDDTGKTWKHLGWDNIKCYSMDMVHASNGRIIYMATGLGVLRSTDYGEHWKQITDWRVSEVMDVAVNQKNPDEVYIATGHGVWHSTNDGKNWNLEDSLPKALSSKITYDSSYSRVLLASANGVYTKGRGASWARSLGSWDRINALSQESTKDWVAASYQGFQYSEDSGNSFGNGSHGEPIWSTVKLIDDTESGYGRRILGGPRTFSQHLDDMPITVSLAAYRNVSSLLVVGKQLILGSLDQGIMDYNPKPLLPRKSIWTLKSFLVTP